MRNKEVCDDYILRLNGTLVRLIFNGRAEMKLATLAFLGCREIEKKTLWIRNRLLLGANAF